MKPNVLSLVIPALWMFLIATVVRAGTFYTSTWTNDASTYIAAPQTTWAYHFGPTTAVVGGFNVSGGNAASLDNADVKLEGPSQILPDVTNNVTGTGSTTLAGNFADGGDPVTTVTLKNLTVGHIYSATFLSVGWQDDLGFLAIVISPSQAALTASKFSPVNSAALAWISAFALITLLSPMPPPVSSPSRWRTPIMHPCISTRLP